MFCNTWSVHWSTISVVLPVCQNWPRVPHPTPHPSRMSSCLPKESPIWSCTVFAWPHKHWILFERFYSTGRYWRHLVRAQTAMKEHLGAERFVFDAFVSYTFQDQKWVIKELLQKIEYEANIKLCLHQRCEEISPSFHFGKNTFAVSFLLLYALTLGGKLTFANLIDTWLELWYCLEHW